jgi:streptogramin lyase
MLVLLLPWFGFHSQQDAIWTRPPATLNPAITVQCGATRSTPTNKIARIAMDGTVTEYPVPTPNALLIRITAGPDGALWFAEYFGNKIGRITVTGQVTEYPIPSAPPLDTPAGQLMTSGPLQVAVGPDRALWFTEFNANQIGRLTTDGQFTEYPVPTPKSSPYQIVAGPDGALWFTENDGNKIGRLALVTAPGLPNTGGGVTQAQPLPIALLAALSLVAVLVAIAHRATLRRHRAR